MTCAKCGVEVAEGVSVCPQCGALFGVQRSPQQSNPSGYDQAAGPAQGSPSPYGSYPAAYQPQYPVYPQLPPPNDAKAIISLVLGILSLVCCFVGGFVAGIGAVILGHLSRSNIRKSAGKLQGDGMALAGLIMGYISFAYIPVMIAMVVMPNMTQSKVVSNETNAVASVRTVNTAEITYQATYPDKGFAPNLATMGGTCAKGGGSSAEHACLLDEKLGAPTCTGNTWCTEDGYKFIIQADTTEPHKTYTVTAIPISSTTGKRGFCSTEEGLINFDISTTRARPYTAAECRALPAL